MSPTKAAPGSLLRALPASDKALMDGPRGSTPVVGATVHLWRLPGTWSVWSPGPATGTWWLQARDAHAEQVLDALAPHPDKGLPDVTQVYVTGRIHAVAVRTKAIRAGGR